MILYNLYVITLNSLYDIQIIKSLVKEVIGWIVCLDNEAHLSFFHDDISEESAKVVSQCEYFNTCTSLS